MLLKDCVFYRSIIERYKELSRLHEDKSNINTYWKEVSIEMDYTPSKHSQPKQIRERLLELDDMEENMEKAISQLQKKI